MCLAVPLRVVEIGIDGQAVVERGARQWQVGVDLLDTIAPGDYVIVQHHQAIVRLDADEAGRTLELLEQIASALKPGTAG